MASRSRTLAVGRGRVAGTALAAVLGLGLAALPVAAGAAVSGPASSSANGAAAASQAAATAGQRGAAHPGTTRAALTMLAERARLAAKLHDAAGAARKTGAITGTVLGANSQPIAGACVTAVGSSVSVTATAAPGGTFVLAGLAPGRYALEYRDCAAAGRYLPAWSGGVAWHSAAALVQVAANQIRHVPVMMLKSLHPATVLSGTARFRQALAASNRSLTAAAAATTGRISGLVTGHGKPLGGICVAAFAVTSGHGYGAITAKNGTYAVRHVAPGRYFVVFGDFFGCPSSGNWLPQLYPDDSSPFAGFGQPGGTPVVVTSGHATRGIDAHLRLGGQISGTVTGPAGRKLGGVCVNVAGDVPGGQVEFSAATSAKGTYQLHALFPGKYFVQFAVGCGVGGNYAPATHRPVRIGYGQDVSGVNQVLSPGASVTGKVTLGSSAGKPLAGMCVYASSADGSVSGQTATGPHGNYRVIGLGSGNYQLEIGPGCNNDANYTTVDLSASTTAGKQTSGVNAVLQPGATISGTVTDRKGRPVPGMCIEVDQTAGASAAAASFGDDATADDGSYVVNQLSAGTYDIGFFTGCGNSANYAPYWYDNQTDESLATPIVLATGASQSANAKLQPGAAIAGTVTDASGHALSGICVYAATESQAQLGQAFTELGQTGTHGRYTISGLAPGQYLVDFGCGQDTRYADQWFDGAASAGSADLVSAPAGRTAGINAVLQPAGSISGVITGTAGRPLAGVCVTTVNTKDGLSQLGAIFVGNQPTTGSHGAYRVTGLAAGRYDVLFQPCSGASRYAEQWYRQHGSTSFQTAVRVRSGKQTSGIDARLSIGGTISGHAVGAAGKPLRNICVFAFDPVTNYSGIGTTGRNGAYTIPALPSDTYTVEFFPCGNQNLIPVLSSAKVTAPHAVTGLNATLRPGGSISGIVTAAGSGSPIVNACVEVFSSDPNNLGGFGGTNADGSYLATGLPTGTYQVYFDPACLFGTGSFVPQWYNNQPTQATADPVSVTVGHTTPSINAALQQGALAGQITGTVTGPTSAPLAGICVTAVPFSADLAGSPPIVAVSRTGDYRLIGLTPGQYKVEFSSGCGASGYQRQWWQDASSRSAATPVSVGTDQVVPGISAKMSA